MSTTTAALDKRAYQGAPEGFKRSSFPNGEAVLHPSKWKTKENPHYKPWHFDDDLKTRAKNSRVHKPITTDDALKLIQEMMKGLKS